MEIVIKEDQFSVLLEVDTGIRHLKFEDSLRKRHESTVCDIGTHIFETKADGIYTRMSEKFVPDPTTAARYSNCKECMKIATSGNANAIFVSEKECDFWTKYGKKSESKINKMIENEYERLSNKGAYVSNEIKFINGSSIKVYAISPGNEEDGDDGDSVVEMTFTSFSNGKTQEQCISFNPSTFSRVADAIIYLVSSVKNDLEMQSNIEFRDPNKELVGILTE